MNCLGCYIDIKEGYCLACRKTLFGKAKVSSILSFDAPKADNTMYFQEHTKRLSISGMQLKYSLTLEKNTLVLNEKNAQYILKPIPPAKHLMQIDTAPENEHLTMQIAAQVFNINTAANALIYFKDGEPAYLTKRFDVKPDGTKYQQEDFAQLTNRTKATHGETFKYDSSYEEIGTLVKKFVPAAIPTLEKLFQIIVFNYIFSNGDAHLKNFSLMRTDAGEYILTPAYDLMCTALHTPLESEVALDLYEGDINSPYYSSFSHYGRENFMELAKRFGIVEKRAARIIDSFSLKIPLVEALVERSFLSEVVRGEFMGRVRVKVGRLLQ
jgi:serine/threonine-protein kinase HipA